MPYPTRSWTRKQNILKERKEEPEEEREREREGREYNDNLNILKLQQHIEALKIKKERSELEHYKSEEKQYLGSSSYSSYASYSSYSSYNSHSSYNSKSDRVGRDLKYKENIENDSSYSNRIIINENRKKKEYKEYKEEKEEIEEIEKIEKIEKREEREEENLSKLIKTLVIQETITRDIVFPSFEFVTYEYIADCATIEIPEWLESWIEHLLEMVSVQDYKEQTVSFEWMSLLNPSLILLSKRINQKSLCKKAKGCIYAFQQFVLDNLALHDFTTINDLLICVELFEEDKVPSEVWNGIDDIFQSINGIDEFIDSCLKKSESKIMKQLLKFRAQSVETQTANVRNAWGSCVGVYTHVARLHRIVQRQSQYLSEQTLKQIFRIIQEFNEQYIPPIVHLFPVLVTKSNTTKIDYPYIRYKTLCMGTHTATSIAPLFGGYCGIFTQNKINESKSIRNDVVLDSWFCLLEAICENMQQFVTSIDELLSESKKTNYKTNNKNINPWLQKIDKLPKSKSHHFRSLDNIAYVSVCLLTMTLSIDSNQKEYLTYKQSLLYWREKVIDKLKQLAENNLLFEPNLVSLQENIFQDQFLTYDKHEKQKWSLHLMAGLFLCFWQM